MESQEAKPIVEPVKKSSGTLITVVVMAIFVLLCLGSVIFLFYQNQQLKMMLAEYKVQNTPQPIVSPEPSTKAETPGWKMYTNTNTGFQIKIPVNFKITKSDQRTDDQNLIVSLGNTDNYCDENTKIYINIFKVIHDIAWEEDHSYDDKFDKIKSNDLSKIHKNKIKFSFSDPANNDCFPRYIYTVYFNDNKNKLLLDIIIPSSLEEQYYEDIYQILSTFKFLDDEALTIQNFANEYAKIYIAADWDKLYQLLTKSVQKEFQEYRTSLQNEEYLDNKYDILSTKKNSDGSYSVTVRFYVNGNAMKGPGGDSVIRIVKENGDWKTITWYLYQ